MNCSGYGGLGVELVAFILLRKVKSKPLHFGMGQQGNDPGELAAAAYPTQPSNFGSTLAAGYDILR